MYPHERLLVKQYQNRPFALIGVNSDRDREALEQVLREKNLNWRSFWDEGSANGPISTAWNIGVWPTIYLIDHEGVIRYRNVRGDDLDSAIEELVEKAEAAQK